MAIGEPSGECYEKIKLHSNHLLDYYDFIIIAKIVFKLCLYAIKEI